MSVVQATLDVGHDKCVKDAFYTAATTAAYVLDMGRSETEIEYFIDRVDIFAAEGDTSICSAIQEASLHGWLGILQLKHNGLNALKASLVAALMAAIACRKPVEINIEYDLGYDDVAEDGILAFMLSGFAKPGSPPPATDRIRVRVVPKGDAFEINVVRNGDTIYSTTVHAILRCDGPADVASKTYQILTDVEKGLHVKEDENQWNSIVASGGTPLAYLVVATLNMIRNSTSWLY